jgi:hypothetical protein
MIDANLKHRRKNLPIDQEYHSIAASNWDIVSLLQQFNDKNNKGIIYDVSEICKINMWSSLLGMG